MESDVNSLTLSVSSIGRARGRSMTAARCVPEGSQVVTLELLWKVLAPKRMELTWAMTGAGPMSIREAARRVGRDVKAVHGDIHALLKAGILDRTEDGRVVFPYDAVKVEFSFGKAA
jgi:predicted transcriptional regulator